jgi:hypothetical protein
MATTKRRDSAQVTLRMQPQDRDAIRAAIPPGELNAVARRLLLDYAREVRAAGRLPLGEEGPTAA